MNGSVEGCAGYKVGDQVRTHTPVRRAASTSSTRTTRRSTPRTGSRCPRRPGVKLHHIMTVNLSAGTIDHVVNGVGDPADTTKIGVPVYIVDYPAP